MRPFAATTCLALLLAACAADDAGPAFQRLEGSFPLVSEYREAL